MYRKVKTLSAFFLALVLISVLALPAFAAGGGGGGAAEKKESGGLFGNDAVFYVHMDPMILPIMGDRGLQEVVSMLVALEVKSQNDIEKINPLIPKLKDGYMRALYGRLNNKAYRSAGFLDVNKLRTKLTEVTTRVVGVDLVKNVLIQGVNQRRFN